jgi:hypothetical protein
VKLNSKLSELDVTSGPSDLGGVSFSALDVTSGPKISGLDVTSGPSELGGIAFSKLNVTSGLSEISIDVASVSLTSLLEILDGLECSERPCGVVPRRASSSEGWRG